MRFCFAEPTPGHAERGITILVSTHAGLQESLEANERLVMQDVWYAKIQTGAITEYLVPNVYSPGNPPTPFKAVLLVQRADRRRSWYAEAMYREG